MIAPTSFFADYGCHVRILEEARILQKLGHAVTIVTYANGGPVTGLDIRRTLPIPWRREYEVGASRHKIAFDALLGAKTLELLATRKFDVIHAHLHEGALIGWVLGRLFRLPVVFDFQGSLTGEMVDHHFLREESSAYGPLLRLETWLDRSCPVVLTSSAHARDLLVSRHGCEPSRILPLPDCVNVEIFRPAAQWDRTELDALRSRLGIPNGRRLVVYLGLLAPYQGTDLLLEAMRRIVAMRRDVHLLLMGFPNVETYRQQVSQLGIGEFVTLTGRIPYQQAPVHLALGNVAVSPKLSLTEGSGKLLNYMATGLPVVAFDTPVAREYLDVWGAYAARGDARSLAAKLLECLFPAPGAVSAWAKGQRLRERAVQDYSWEWAGRQIVSIYRVLVDHLGQPPLQDLRQLATSRLEWPIIPDSASGTFRGEGR